MIAPEVSDTLTQRYSKGTRGRDGLVVVCPDTANCLTRRMHKGINTTVDEGQTPIVTFNPLQDPIPSTDGKSHALTAGSSRGCASVGVYTKARRAHSKDDYETWVQGDIAPTLNTFDVGETRCTTVVPTQADVRRLTPLECERLQGFPDNYTAIEFQGKQASDSRRYKALGNSWAVPVARWIGERINLVEEVSDEV